MKADIQPPLTLVAFAILVLAVGIMVQQSGPYKKQRETQPENKIAKEPHAPKPAKGFPSLINESPWPPEAPPAVSESQQSRGISDLPPQEQNEPAATQQSPQPQTGSTTASPPESTDIENQAMAAVEEELEETLGSLTLEELETQLAG